MYILTHCHSSHHVLCKALGAFKELCFRNDDYCYYLLYPISVPFLFLLFLSILYIYIYIQIRSMVPAYNYFLSYILSFFTGTASVEMGDYSKVCV